MTDCLDRVDDYVSEIFLFVAYLTMGPSAQTRASNSKMIYSSKMSIFIHHTRCHNLDDHNMNLHCSGIIHHMLMYLFYQELALHKNTSHSILKLRIFHTKLHMQLIFQNSTMKKFNTLFTKRFMHTAHHQQYHLPLDLSIKAKDCQKIR